MPSGEVRLTLAQKLALFDPKRHGGEAMPSHARRTKPNPCKQVPEDLCSVEGYFAELIGFREFRLRYSCRVARS